MTDLEQQLVALGAEIGFPPTPELAMPTTTEPRPRPRRLVLAGIALAALALCFGAVLAASPGARSGLRDLFGIGSVRVTRLEGAPPEASGPLVPFGQPVSLDEAEHAVTFELRRPSTIRGRPPSQIYLDRTVGGGLVSFVWCCRPRIVLSELLGDRIEYLHKMVGPSTRIENVSVDGNPGLWVEGSDHILRVIDSNGTYQQRSIPVRGGVLLWIAHSLTLRLEGDLTREQALAIARSVT